MTDYNKDSIDLGAELETEGNSTHELIFDEVYVSLNNYVKYAAKSVASSSSISDSSLSTEDLYQEGLLLLIKCYNKYKNKEKEHFDAIFKTSLWRHIRKQANHKQLTKVDIEDAYDLGYTENTVEKMFVEYGMSQLSELLKHEEVALLILKELIEPSTRTLWEMNMDVSRKETVKSQGKKVNIPQGNSVKMLHIKRALDITQKQFDLGIMKVREVATQVFGSDCLQLEY